MTPSKLRKYYSSTLSIATAFQELWTTYGWQVDKRHGVTNSVKDDGDEYCVDCCSNSEPTDDSDAKTPDTARPPTLPALSAETNGHRTTPAVAVQSASPRSPACPSVFQWYAGKLSTSLRAIAFLITLVAVAAVPILIVVYRGRAIGWLMTAVFHQDDSEQRARDTTGRRHRRHNFFLLNYTNSGELSNWKTAVAALCATFVQLTAIVAVHRGYSAVATWLTKHSYRTVYDTRFQRRYTAYMSCFDSANYYSSLVYIAFFKVHARLKYTTNYRVIL